MRLLSTATLYIGARANASKSQTPDPVSISGFDKKLSAIAKTLIQSAFPNLDAFALVDADD